MISVTILNRGRSRCCTWNICVTFSKPLKMYFPRVRSTSRSHGMQLPHWLSPGTIVWISLDMKNSFANLQYIVRLFEFNSINTLRPRQNGRHFADDIFKYIFLIENVWIPIKISLMFVLQGSINKIPALVQIMAWCRRGDKPLSGPMVVKLPTHICVTRPQWVKLDNMISPYCLHRMLH